MRDPSQAMLEGLTDRVRNLLRTLDRKDRLETARAFVGWLESEQREQRLPEAAREMLLRALRLASDPINYNILTCLNPEVGLAVSDLMAKLGLARVAVSERLNDLLQVGLVSRELTEDQIRATSLAIGLVEWIENLASQAGQQLDMQLKAPGDGRPPHGPNAAKLDSSLG